MNTSCAFDSSFYAMWYNLVLLFFPDSACRLYWAQNIFLFSLLSCQSVGPSYSADFLLSVAPPCCYMAMLYPWENVAWIHAQASDNLFWLAKYTVKTFQGERLFPRSWYGVMSRIGLHHVVYKYQATEMQWNIEFRIFLVVELNFELFLSVNKFCWPVYELCNIGCLQKWMSGSCTISLVYSWPNLLWYEMSKHEKKCWDKQCF